MRANERHLNQIINTIPTMVWSALPGRLLGDFFSKRWLDYAGLTLEQALDGVGLRRFTRTICKKMCWPIGSRAW